MRQNKRMIRKQTWKSYRLMDENEGDRPSAKPAPSRQHQGE